MRLGQASECRPVSAAAAHVSRACGGKEGETACKSDMCPIADKLANPGGARMTAAWACSTRQVPDHPSPVQAGRAAGEHPHPVQAGHAADEKHKPCAGRPCCSETT